VNKNTQISNLAVNAQADALTPLLASGKINLYSGTQPASSDTALAANTLLVAPVFGATAFPAAVAGVLTANAISAATAVATGKATFARCMKTDGTTAVMDQSVGMQLTGADFTFTAATKTIAKAAGGFSSTNLLVGDQLVVSGSASNNATFTVATLPGDGSITVNEAVVTEAPGAAVTLKENKNLILSNVNIGIGVSVSISSLVHTLAKATAGL
jgi:hypothetical protein